MANLRKQAISGFFWSFLQQFGTMAIVFIVSILLARVLNPKDFGLIALFKVLVAIATVFVNGGLTSSLIRTSKTNDADYSTVFFFNLVVSVGIYFLLFFTGPMIAKFYGTSELLPIIRVFSIVIVIQGFTAVQMSIINKMMDFKLQFKIQLPSLILSGIIGIVLAYLDYGVWSLVYMNIVQVLMQSILYWKVSPWKPQFVFDNNKFAHHFNFGYKITISNLIDTAYRNIYSLIIGKFFTLGQLGFYDRANNLKEIPVANLANALNKVTFPLFCTIQNDDIKLKDAYRKIMKIVSYVISPIMVLCIILAKSIITILLTDKWLEAVPLFQILCVSGIIYPLVAYNLNILQVKGKSTLYLKAEIIKKVIGVIIIILSVNYGLKALLWAQVIIVLLDFVINSYFTGKVLSYNTKSQILDVAPIICFTVLAGIGTFLIDQHFFNNWHDLLRIIVVTIIYLITYFMLLFLSRNSVQLEVFNILKNFLKKSS